MGGHSCVATWELITGADMTLPCSPVGEFIYFYLTFELKTYKKCYKTININ